MRGATAMRKKLVRHGNSRALVIDKAILELLKIDDDTEVDVSVNGQTLVITPALEEEAARERFDSAVERSLRRYDGVFKRLAE